MELPVTLPVFYAVPMLKTLHGDCLNRLKEFPDAYFTAAVTDPPYGLRFVGKRWDYQIPSVETWKEILRTLKPGGYLLSFGGSRTFHRMACAVEDAGFEIRDCVMWLYGSGFPKSMDVSKAIDKAAGAEREVRNSGEREGTIDFGMKNRCSKCGKPYFSGNPCRCPRPEKIAVTDAARQWSGWGTALKPAHEPIIVARKPLDGTVAANVLEYGCGGLNIDGCRIGTEQTRTVRNGNSGGERYGRDERVGSWLNPPGRFPANVIHDGSEEVLAGFPRVKGNSNKCLNARETTNKIYGTYAERGTGGMGRNDSGSAARFFYCAKASKSERTHKGKVTNKHPTVKPLALMKYLLTLIRQPETNIILDPFCGSGSTLVACRMLGLDAVGIDADMESIRTSRERIAVTPKGK